MSARRIFWGRSLQQAIAKAARHHRVDPDALAWKPYEKRHGFVKHPRAALIEVDPEAPTRAPGTEPTKRAGAPAETPPPRSAPEPSPSSPPSFPQPSPAVRSEPEPPTRRREGRRSPRKVVARRNDEPFDAPDEDAESAALEGCQRILRFLAIDAEASASRSSDRLTVEIRGETSALEGVTLPLLDEIEHLLGKAIVTLSGRRVRVSVDSAGLRGARAAELESRARRAAVQVVETGESFDLGPLTAADRRVVHLAFEGDPRVATESLGDGALKRVLLVPRASS